MLSLSHALCGCVDVGVMLNACVNCKTGVDAESVSRSVWVC